MIIKFNVYSCSSVNWIKCDGPYQFQCTEWESMYELEDNETWLRTIEYFNFKRLNFFKIWGIIILLSFVMHIILSLLLGRNLINSILNIQIIIVLTVF